MARHFVPKFSLVSKEGSFGRDGRQRQMRQQGKITFPEIGRQVKRLCTAVKCAQIQEEMGKEIQSDSRRNTIRRYWRNE